jgi:hypothetical protein
MFNQTLRNICSFFSPGKKSIFSTGNTENIHTGNSKNTDKTNMQLLYHRDLNNVQARGIETKAGDLQHDWWIN